MEKIRYDFGKYQTFVSDKMRRNPAVGKLVSNIFGYTTVGGYGRMLIFRHLLSLIPMEMIKKILDLGCGQGEFSFMLADAHKDALVDAMDIDKISIKKIEETAEHFGLTNLKTFNCKIQELDRKGYYDLIFAIDVFEHILEPEMPFADCHKMLKTGGYLVIKMPAKTQRLIAPESWFGEFNQFLDAEHIGQVYDLDDLIERFRKENFRIIAAFYSDGIIARAGWEFNYFMRKGGTLMHLMSLPLSKVLMKTDKLIKEKKRGNYIQVIGQKI